MEEKNQNNNSQYKSNEEEIDLGQLFSLIGKGFSNIFRFIGSIFSTMFRWAMYWVIFIKKHLLVLLAATILGYSLGWIYKHYIEIPVYESSMTVQPNFGSTMQLYKNIDYYQSLVYLKDYKRLATSLNISEEEAKNLKKFRVEPYTNENETLLAFKRFVSNLDSTIVNKIDYKKFIQNQPTESFKFHIVTVESKDKYIFGKLRSPIISSIIRNDYYNQVKTTSYANLMSRKKAIEANMGELDTLRTLYKKVMLAESKKEVNGTSIYLGNTAKDNKEVVVFDKYMRMNQALIDVNKQLTEENEVINVVSSFNPVGKRLGGLKRNYPLLGGVFGFLLTIIFLSGKLINNMIVKYEKELEMDI